MLLGAMCACAAPGAAENSDIEPVTEQHISGPRALLRDGNVDGAVEAFQALVAAHPDSVRAHRGLQDALKERLSAEDFSRLYEEPTRGPAPTWLQWYLFGRARIEDQGAARRAFEEAARLAPMQPWPVVGLAFLHSARGDLFQTIECFESGLERMPRSALLRTSIAWQYLDLSLLVDAQQHIEAALRLAPDDEEALTAQGVWWSRRGQHDRAIERLKPLAQRRPDLARIFPALAESYLATGRAEQALSTLDRLAELGRPVPPGLAADVRAATVVAKVRAGAASPPSPR